MWKKKLFYIIGSITFAVIIFFFACNYMFKIFGSSEWSKEIGVFSSLGTDVIKYELFLPSEYGYKDIRMVIPDVDKKYLNAEIDINIINKSDSNMHIVSHNYFVGKLDKNKKANIFHGTLKQLIDFYNTGDAPSISNSHDNEKILILISSNEEVNFASPVKLYAYAADCL